MKGLHNLLLVVAAFCLMLFFSLVVIDETRYHVIHHLIYDHGMPFILLCVVGILFFALLAINCLISRCDLANQNKTLQVLRKKIACVTAGDSILIMQYDVKAQMFIRWNEKTGEEYRHFSLADYWKYIHVEDLPIAQKLVDHMNTHQTNSFVCEYRYQFPGTKDYSWQLNEIFPFELNKKGEPVSYIGVCHKNNKWHEIQDKTKSFHDQINFIMSSVGIGFALYHVNTDTFHGANEKGELSEHEISMDSFVQCIYPEDRPHFLSVIKKLKEGKDDLILSNAEYRSCIFNNPGVYKWYVGHFMALRKKDAPVENYVCLFRRNDQWHNMLDKVKTYSNKISFISSMSGIIFANFDTKTNILNCLSGEGDFKGYSMTLDEYLGFVYPDDRLKGEQVVKMMKEHTLEHFHTEYRFTHPWTNEYIWYSVDIAATEYDSNHQITGYTWLNRNNDAWHKAMDEMLELQGKAELAKMQSSFLSNINHEIRTPLNAIVGFSNIMCDEDSYEERARYRDIIDNNNQKLLRIVDDVLMLSKIESDDINFKYTTVDIADFFKKLIDKIRPLVGPNVQLICKCDKPLTSTLDVTYLKNVTSALLNNAIKFTHEGSITLDYAAKDGGLYVSVTDTGIGIAQEEQERIFERFEKVDSFKEGTGIGLPICKAIITKVNGKIGVESQLGKGSTFWYWVPRKTSES